MRNFLSAAAMVAGTAVLVAAPGAPTLAQGLDQPPPGAEVETQEFQEWSLRCIELEGQRRCEMLQPVEDPESGEPVMAVVVPSSVPNQPLVAWFVLPLGVLLPPGIAISVDGSEPERLPIRHCEPGGCLAPLELEGGILQRLQNGVELQVMAYGIDEQQVSIPISLMGFTAALNALP
ncbi:MAG TPA: invasion associated locus B family protein [Kiloniellales bacterium]|nr:invasion associated locus B family protein [Kiloniellales bacterium]